LIVASGIKNHNEYVDLVKERLGDMLPVPEHGYERPQSVYIGGEHRAWSESPHTSIQLAFESCSWQHEDLPAYYVMNTLIGQATSFSSGGPGKGMYCRAITNVMQKHGFVDGASAINHHFTDTGIFGMSIEGHGSHSKDLLNVLVGELSHLKERISEEELSRSKNILKMNILMAMERQGDRLEEIARNYMTMGR
jgi:predicted Zn-dependent peptidase